MSSDFLKSKVFILFVILSLLGITFMVLALYPFANSVFGTILLNLGVTLLTSGTISVLFEVSARREASNEIMEKVSTILTPLPPTIIAWDNRNLLSFQNLIENSGQRLDLMGLTLPDITEQGLLPLCFAAIQNRGTKFRILLLNPNSEAAKVRARYPQYDYAEAIFEVSRSSILRLHKFSSQLKARGVDQEKFDFRLYNELPLCLTITDSSLILSVYILDVIGQHAPYLEFKGQDYSSRFCVSLRDHFDSIWNSSIRITSMTDNEIIQFVENIKVAQDGHSLVN